MEPFAIYRLFLWGGVMFLALTACVCLVRAILGPRFTDRIVAINIICTKTIIAICLIAFLQGLNYLLDIAVVYSMISFLAVVVLSKCYLLPGQRQAVDIEEELAHLHHREEETLS